MESSIQTEIERARGKLPDEVEPIPGIDDAPTERLPVTPVGDSARGAPAGGGLEAAGAQPHALIGSLHDQCAACGSAMADDQRYCVECGERRGRARVPQLEGIAARAAQASDPAPASKHSGLTVNSTLLAIIGTLLLAMGVGVLIGRTSSSSSKPPPAQVVTIAGSGAGSAATGTGATRTSGTAAGASKSSTSGSAAKAETVHTKAKVKVVKIGSPGKGPGYQHGHFTGNFFGPESEK